MCQLWGFDEGSYEDVGEARGKGQESDGGNMKDEEKEMLKLSDDKLSVWVARLCGWHSICSHVVDDKVVWYGWHPIHNPKETRKYEIPLPSFCSDLNAINEAEKVMTRGQQRKYTKLLSPKYTKNLSATWCILHAKARERAEAFVKAME